jgi:dihydrodipicolinate synthase/N-acetylneuraminate lyase
MEEDPFWTPLIGHYGPDGGLDEVRVRRHVAAIAPHVRQYLLAGTTGDGWTMSDAVLRQWLALASRPDAFGPDQSFLVGAFGDTTDAAIERAATIEDHFLRHRPVARFAGLTLCAPVDPQAS